jgi:hypothetical protein
MLQDARAMPTDADGLSDGALRTVRADQIPGANIVLCASRSVANPRHDRVT